MSAIVLQKAQNQFRKALINWYDSNARNLPWRTTPSLYKTVVSEFMLQQTQVKTVLPYFDKWLKRFPDFEALAKASEDQVLKHWEGLGYYSRARNLHKLSKEFLTLEKIPQDAKSWLRFPGVGPYAAAAITSIALGTPAAVVDGNVVRILSRLCADDTPFKTSTDAAKAYRPITDTLLNTKRPGDHNQAMMELGATICHKRKPQCLLCPVMSLCKGRSLGIEEDLPVLDKVKSIQKTVDRAWIIQNGKFLLHRIPASASQMSGLHEIPNLEQLQLKAERRKAIIERKRSITKYRITERFFSFKAESIKHLSREDFLWVNKDDLKDLAFSGPHSRWIEELLAL